MLHPGVDLGTSSCAVTAQQLTSSGVDTGAGRAMRRDSAQGNDGSRAGEEQSRWGFVATKQWLGQVALRRGGPGKLPATIPRGVGSYSWPETADETMGSNVRHFVRHRRSCMGCSQRFLQPYRNIPQGTAPQLHHRQEQRPSSTRAYPHRAPLRPFHWQTTPVSLCMKRAQTRLSRAERNDTAT